MAVAAVGEGSQENGERVENKGTESFCEIEGDSQVDERRDERRGDLQDGVEHDSEAMAARARELRTRLVELSGVRWKRVERIRRLLLEGNLDTDAILDETADAVLREEGP